MKYLMFIVKSNGTFIKSLIATYTPAVIEFSLDI